MLGEATEDLSPEYILLHPLTIFLGYAVVSCQPILTLPVLQALLHI